MPIIHALAKCPSLWQVPCVQREEMAHHSAFLCDLRTDTSLQERKWEPKSGVALIAQACSQVQCFAFLQRSIRPGSHLALRTVGLDLIYKLPTGVKREAITTMSYLWEPEESGWANVIMPDLAWTQQWNEALVSTFEKCPCNIVCFFSTSRLYISITYRRMVLFFVWLDERNHSSELNRTLKLVTLRLLTWQ